jgi:hypothetical protein
MPSSKWAGSPADSSPTAPRPSAPSSSPSGWAASTPPPKSWAPPGRRCARPSPATTWGCRRATPRPPASAAVGRPRRALTRSLWRSTAMSFRSGPGRVGSWPSGCAAPRTTRPWARGWWWSCTAKATPPSPARGRGRSPAAPSVPSGWLASAPAAPSGARPTVPAAPTDPTNNPRRGGWYLRFGLSYRDVEELLPNAASSSTTSRSTGGCSASRRCWPTPLGPADTPVGDRWQVDETYVKAAGQWRTSTERSTSSAR